MIADRGYWDCDDDRLKIPAFLNEPQTGARRNEVHKNRRQIPTDEANATRQVTFVTHN